MKVNKIKENFGQIYNVVEMTFYFNLVGLKMSQGEKIVRFFKQSSLRQLNNHQKWVS